MDYFLNVVILQTRALDVDVDNANTGRASLVAIAKAAGVKSPLVTYEQVRAMLPVVHAIGI